MGIPNSDTIKPHFPLRSLNPPAKPKPTTQASSHTNLVFKLLLLLFFLVAFPLFPAQAPEFFDQKVFSEFWELLHLLLIGVAVSYGLFSRRNSDSVVERPSFNAPRVDDFLSIFEDGYEISYANDERKTVQGLNSLHGSQGESKVRLTDDSEFVNDEHVKSKGLSFESDGNVVDSWSYQYFQCEPMVVVAQPNFRPADECDHKPLGLPIRSLRSRIVAEPSRRRSRSRGESSSGSGNSRMRSDYGRNGAFGDIDTSNSDKKSDETVAAVPSSPIPWRSGSERMENRTDHLKLHARHLSVEESQSKHDKMRSFWSSASFTSNASSASLSSLSNKLSPSHAAAEDWLKMENSANNKGHSQSPVAAPTIDDAASSGAPGYERGMGRNLNDGKHFSENVMHSSLNLGNIFHSSSMNNSVSQETSHSQRCDNIPLDRLNYDWTDLDNYGSHVFSGKKFPVGGSHSRSYTSIGCFPDVDDQKTLEGDSVDSGCIIRENLSHRRRLDQGSLKLDIKPRSGTTKASLKGKSVRTFRASRQTEEVNKSEQICQNLTGEESEEAQVKTDRLCRKEEGNKTNHTDRWFGSTSEQTLGKSSSVSQQKFAKFENDRTISEERVGEAENARVRVDVDAVGDSFSDVGSEANEVDKKAGEFIAKFREQIRLQKTLSIDKSIGTDMSEDDYR